MAPFDCSLLNEGSNTIILLQYRAGRYNSILYDAVRLELPYFSDMNGDREVDMPDLLLFASEWLTSGESQADFNEDDIVDKIQEELISLRKEIIEINNEISKLTKKDVKLLNLDYERFIITSGGD